jgi:hypothetical protein
MTLEKLLSFLSTAENDPRLSPVHISLYLALFHRWCQLGSDPISFSRPEIMRAAKISSRATYHRCMRELHDYRYIRYIPSHHPVLGSIAFLGQITGRLQG